MTAFKKIIQHHRDWLVKSESRIPIEFNYLKEDLSDGTLSALDNVSDSLGRLATYFGIKGILAVNDDVQSGWEDISKSLNYRYWALKIRAKSFSKTAFLGGIKAIPNLTNQIGNAGCLLAAFVAMDRDDLAAPVADVLLGMLTIKGAVNSDHLRLRNFEPFMIWLYSVYSGENVNSEIVFSDLGVYQRVIDSWDKSDELSFALDSLCEYHVSNATDAGGRRDPEFKNPPFDLLPLEINAISVVRKKLGLEMPYVNHPLLSLKTSSADQIFINSDDLSDEVEIAYNRLFGGR
ncbi:MAG TPA: hypothetical protein DCS87_13335 [Rheinheimera sp.]|nr:hypothetical protein [Rheinheimera sp.]